MMQTLSQIPDKAWLFAVLLALVGVFAYRPDPMVQKWIEYVLIGLIAVLRGGTQTTVVVGEPKVVLDGLPLNQASKVMESLRSNG